MTKSHTFLITAFLNIFLSLIVPLKVNISCMAIYRYPQLNHLNRPSTFNGHLYMNQFSFFIRLTLIKMPNCTCVVINNLLHYSTLIIYCVSGKITIPCRFRLNSNKISRFCPNSYSLKHLLFCFLSLFRHFLPQSFYAVCCEQREGSVGSKSS